VGALPRYPVKYNNKLHAIYKVIIIEGMMREITPKKLRCAFGSCPGVFEVDEENLLIIGKELPPELKEKIQSRVGEGEYAIVIPREFFSELK
jgi:hypothetical protein